MFDMVECSFGDIVVSGFGDMVVSGFDAGYPVSLSLVFSFGLNVWAHLRFQLPWRGLGLGGLYSFVQRWLGAF